MSYSNFNTFKLFENVGINSSSDYMLSMRPNDNNVSFHSSNSIDYNNVDIMSIKNIINKKQNEDLNLSSLTGTTINPVITINNNHSDCRIMTNLNVSGNINLLNGEMIRTTGTGSFGSINCGVGTFTSLDSGSITTNNQDINAGSGTVSANTFNGQIAWSNITGTKNTSDLNNNSGYITSLAGLTASYSNYFKVKWKSDDTMYNLLFTNAGSSQSTWQEGYQDSGHWLQWNPSTNLLTSIDSIHIQSTFKIQDHTITRVDANMIRYQGESGNTEFAVRTNYAADSSLYSRVSWGTYWSGAYIEFKHTSFSSSMAISGSSDDRIKTDEELIVNVTPILLKLRPQKYKKYTGNTIEEVKKNIENNSTKYIIESGLIAQEIFYEVPELRFLVGHTIDENKVDNIPRDFKDIKNDPDYSNWPNEISNVNYTGLIPYLIRGFQEQQTKINTLETENQQQQTKINTLETEVSTLKTENAELKSIIDKLKTANSFEDFKNSL